MLEYEADLFRRINECIERLAEIRLPYLKMKWPNASDMLREVKAERVKVVTAEALVKADMEAVIARQQFVSEGTNDNRNEGKKARVGSES
jgi:hypothetical protein